MAPVAPSKRRSLHTKLASKYEAQPYASRRALRPDVVEVSDLFINSKKDKRLIKHSSFVSRIEKTNKKPLKRRRPYKKLVTDLHSLKKALPDLLADGETEEGLKQLKEGKVRLKSLSSRKGALKKKEKVVKGEVERFQGSLARLNAVGAAYQGIAPSIDIEKPGGDNGAEGGEAQSQNPNPTGSRWAALRGFISATMEQNPAFIGTRDDGKRREKHRMEVA
ncbi:ribosome biogenesis protein SLX9-domain-containing protein [Pseudomassariella vexata]|uniref:Ribosome biogenesis protein SLX9 n=1 Tax=Pseudomassariella vexata TaxID=1141098 RepID=A0A1Y2DT78_9PEZI|nr:ribosome biogenesis protein SLX9-domain-containing protein [Pseudomassariella vexata]ORY62478.1 ribosome biogenesis protein SLX9-domain-containing protein [Pseudomassariella vexata]